jgi:hypothetical protein
MDSQRFGVNAAPNESKIRGKIVKIDPGPEGLGSIWTIEVSETEDIDNLPNFARRYVGKLISVLVHPEMKKEIKEFDIIEAHLTFQGDERGGEFFLIDDKVRHVTS